MWQWCARISCRLLAPNSSQKLKMMLFTRPRVVQKQCEFLSCVENNRCHAGRSLCFVNIQLKYIVTKCQKRTQLHYKSSIWLVHCVTNLLKSYNSFVWEIDETVFTSTIAAKCKSDFDIFIYSYCDWLQDVRTNVIIYVKPTFDEHIYSHTQMKERYSEGIFRFLVNKPFNFQTTAIMWFQKIWNIDLGLLKVDAKDPQIMIPLKRKKEKIFNCIPK